jgi:hypothetical protein
MLGIPVGVYFVTAGVSARPQPGGLETFIARTVAKPRDRVACRPPGKPSAEY